jgi:hypothetical protein
MTTVSKQDVVYTSYLSYDKSFNTDGSIGANLANTPILSSLPASGSTSKGTYLLKNGNDSIILSATGASKGGSINLIGTTLSTTSTYLSASSGGTLVPQVTAQNTNQVGTFSSLTPTSLFFTTTDAAGTHQVDYKALIDTHSSAIAALNGNDTLEFATLTQLQNEVDALVIVDNETKDRVTTLENKQPLIISSPLYNVPSVYADSSGSVDYIPQSIAAVTPYSGFYYKNNLNEKVNWYVQPDIGLTVGDIKLILLNFYNVSAVTGQGIPFFSVYTKPDNLTPNGASWYKSRKTFMIDYANVTPSINTQYSLKATLKPVNYSPSAWGHTNLDATNIAGNDKGTFADTESILFFSVGTSSNSQAGLFEFIASKFTVITSSASNEFVFQRK